MEDLSYNDFSHTHLGYNTKLNSEMRPEDLCEKCTMLKKKDWLRWYDFYQNKPCTCVAEGKTKYKVVSLKARGNPIQTAPENTIYIITIWNIERPTRDECKPSILFEEPSKFEIVIDFAVDPQDLVHDNIEIFKIYNDYLTNLTEMNCSFRGKVERLSYIKDFVKRITNIINIEERKNDNNENAHVKRRLKGHSHVK